MKYKYLINLAVNVNNRRSNLHSPMLVYIGDINKGFMKRFNEDKPYTATHLVIFLGGMVDELMSLFTNLLYTVAQMYANSICIIFKLLCLSLIFLDILVTCTPQNLKYSLLTYPS